MASSKLKPGKSLAETHPEIAAQADGWDPNDISAGSKRKVRWLCELGHTWDARIFDRLRFSSGCQVCANRIVLEGFNDLATTHPELAAQADGWDPRTIHKGISKRVDWICGEGHNWKSEVVARTSQEQGCPVCSGRQVLPGFNDLVTTHPELAKEAFGWDPSHFSHGSGKKKSWRCRSGHIFESQIGARSRGNGCPICSGRELQLGFNDLTTRFSKIALEADGWDPRKIHSGSSKKKSWICPLGHKYSATVISRTNKGTGCPVCAGKSVGPGFNDLATKFPKIALEADGWDPKRVLPGTHKKLQWKCSQNHVYEMAPHSRTNKKSSGCPYCAGRRVLPGFNDLLTTHPKIAMEADGWDPTEISAGSHEVKNWKCKQGHFFKVNANQRTSNVSNCPTCANLVIEPGFNDLKTLFPALALEANGWDPVKVGAGSTRRFSWKCQRKGHIWESSVINRTSNGSNCPVCVGQLVIIGVNDLATTHPQIAAQASGWDATTLTAGSKKKRAWRCRLGHEFFAPIVQKTNTDSGCPICLNVQVLVGFNDLATTHPELALEADGWSPSTVTYGSSKKKRWKCNQGHTFSQVVSNRSGIQNQGCPSCAASGFDPNQPGYLYLIDHFDLHMFQIGISNFPEDRLGDHQRRGWEVLELRGPMDGQLTRKLEADCLHALEKRGAILGHKAGIEKFDGYTEAWTKKSLNVTSIKQILDWVYEDEAK